MTPMVKRIIIICAAIWIGEVIAFNWLDSKFFIEIFSLIPIRVVTEYHIWQLFTYMWLHSPTDFMHIVLNLLFLWMFGGTLEAAWGSKHFLRFYMYCGVGAGIIVLFSGLLFSQHNPVLGASGAIYGLVVAWAIAYPNRVIYLFGVFPIKGKHFVLIPIGFAVLDFLTRAKGVSHAAHLGGMAIGALLITGYWRPEKLIRKMRYNKMRRKLRTIEGDKNKQKQNGPPGGGYWH